MSPESKESDLAAGSVPTPLTHFIFQHRVFSSPGAGFVLSGPRRTPMFRLTMSEGDGFVEIDALCREFGIPYESDDGKLIKLAVDGLRFVPDIKPGDVIPTELLTGEASWSVTDSHKRITEGRLHLQLLSWSAGRERVITEPTEIGMMLEQLSDRERVREAYQKAAVTLGRSADDRDYVTEQLQVLIRELSYIEALRQYLGQAARLWRWLNEVYAGRERDQTAKLEIQRIRQLLQKGIQEYSAVFKEVDDRTGNIVEVLKALDAEVKYIRSTRDRLHGLHLLWRPHLAAMHPPPAVNSNDVQKVTSALYRFLAPRYTAGTSMLKQRK